MANAFQRNKNSAVAVGAIVFNPQSSSPIPSSNPGVYADSSGNVQLVNSTGGSPLMQSRTALTNAEMLALRATPKELVAAPGAGYMIEFVSAEIIFDRTGAYTETDDNLAIKYENGSGQAVSETIECTGFVDAAADAIMPAKPITSAVILASAGVNKALVLHNTGNGEFGGGNAANVVTVVCNYRLVYTGL